ncbi:B12-binding domain-containing radical SAM protein [Hyalangium rubrum]|uniref:Radical SAM protein n=1 Tax=Hyalangium rubrum TaxID=3103134 RepID=A0ABU5H7P3_9BACT|nr:radical SAM protein [Hyalangium sp. s54d21]MDY7229491.1 radical SAM protein [Hyalangium sp. s54d21]
MKASATAKGVLVVPGELVPAALRLEDKFPFPLENLSVGYLAAGLEARGIAAHIVDGYAERLDPEATARRVLSELAEGDVLGITVLQSTALAARHLCQEVRGAGFTGPIVLGGWAATMAAPELMRYVPQADLLVKGEADDSFAELVMRLREGRTLEGVPGLSWREGEALRSSETAPRNADFTEPRLPRHYAYERSEAVPAHASLPIQGSRGCYWGRCSFCSTAARYGPRGWRMRSVRSLLEELHHPAVAAASHRVFFVDDEFFGPTPPGFARARELAEALISEGSPVEFGIDCLVTGFDPELFALLRRAGLRRVFLGIEAGSNDSLKTFKKGFAVKQVRQTLAGLEALGIDVISGYILFHPYMRLEEVKRSVDFLADELHHEGNPGKFLSRLHPEQGTELWERLRGDGLLRGAFPDWDYAFRDPRVGQLYEALRSATAGLRQEYTRVRLEQRTDLSARDTFRELNRRFRETFESLYQDACREPAITA